MLTWSCCAWGQCQVGWDTNPMREDGGGRGRKEEWIPAGAVADAGLVSLLLSGLVCSIRNGCTALRVEGGKREWCMITMPGNCCARPYLRAQRDGGRAAYDFPQGEMHPGLFYR